MSFAFLGIRKREVEFKDVDMEDTGNIIKSKLILRQKIDRQSPRYQVAVYYLKVSRFLSSLRVSMDPEEK